MAATAPFENTGWYYKEVYQILFEDNKEDEQVLISSTIHPEDVHGESWCCMDGNLFESKSQSHQTYDAWVRKVMAILENASKMLTVGIKKDLDYSRIHSITMAYENLELLVSRWSVESHTLPLGRSLGWPSRMSWILWPCLYKRRWMLWVMYLKGSTKIPWMGKLSLLAI